MRCRSQWLPTTRHVSIVRRRVATHERMRVEILCDGYVSTADQQTARFAQPYMRLVCPELAPVRDQCSGRLDNRRAPQAQCHASVSGPFSARAARVGRGVRCTRS
jgi:hypothetical protein